MTGEIIQQHWQDLLLLLEDVPEVPKIGAPGVLSVFGSKAFPFLVGKHKNCYHPLGAAARFADGRIVIYSHDGYLIPSKESQNLNQLILNNVYWCSNKFSTTNIKIAVYNRNQALLDFLLQKGFAARLITETEDLNKELSTFDLLCVQNIDVINQVQVEAIKKFVKSGGGLMAANTAWAWDYYGPSGDIRCDHPGNKVSHEAGMGWTVSGYLEETSAASGGFLTDKSLLNGSHALDVWNFTRSRIVQNQAGSVNGIAEIHKILSVLEESLDSMPYEGTELLNQVTAYLKMIPIPCKEVPVDDPMQKLMLTLISSQNSNCSSDGGGEFRRMYLQFNNFPGKVDRNICRLQNQMIDLEIKAGGMYSTGLYAAPGEVLNFEFNPAVPSKGLEVQIGCHTDDISWHKKWSRCPKIVSKKVVPPNQTNVSLGNVFGGLVYISLHDDNQPSFGKISVKISGAVPAPYFLLGTTSVYDWRENIRHRQAPWAELANDKIILTLPSDKVRGILDPEPLMLFWQKVLDADAELAGICKERSRPERIVADIQISAGYMHSGYPIMIHDDVAVDTALSIKELQSNAPWGHFHELGHNHQQDDWTFDGTVEVTCNIFTLYVLNTVCMLNFAAARDSFQPQAMKETVTSFCKGGKNFDTWKEDPFLALLMYYQLQQEFGWGAFKKVFGQYRQLKEDKRPKNNQEKMDVWLIMFSKEVGFDLSGFFISWGIPVREIAVDSLRNLPKSGLNIALLM